MKLLRIGTLVLVLCSSSLMPGAIAAEKVGSKCAMFGKTVIQGKNKLTCIKVTEYKWVSTPIKPPLASVFNPVQPGSKFKISTLQFQAKSVNFDFGFEVCNISIFNDGCQLDARASSSIDPESANRWVGVELSVVNLTDKKLEATDLNFSFYLILPNGKYLENAQAAIYDNSPISISLSPKIATTMQVGFFLPKSVLNLNPVIIIRDDAGTTSKDYFFYLNW